MGCKPDLGEDQTGKGEHHAAGSVTKLELIHTDSKNQLCTHCTLSTVPYNRSKCK